MPGFVLEKIGVLPQPGKHPEPGGGRIDVVDGRRIDKLLVQHKTA